jgi:hypothetical protein
MIIELWSKRSPFDDSTCSPIDMSQVLQGIISRGIERIIPNNCSRIMKQFLSRALHFALDMNRSTK